MVWCVMKNAGQVLADDQQGEENTRDRNGGRRNEKQRTTRVQSPSTLFTSQQNLLTDNWFNPPRPLRGNKLHKHLPAVTRSAESRGENINTDKNWRGVVTRNDYYGQDRCCNVDIVAYLLVTPHMLASELPSWITTVQSISHYHHNSLTDPDIILPLFQIKLILNIKRQFQAITVKVSKEDEGVDEWEGDDDDEVSCETNQLSIGKPHEVSGPVTGALRCNVMLFLCTL